MKANSLEPRTNRRILYLSVPGKTAPLAEACFCLTPKVAVGNEGEIFLDIATTQKALGGEARVLLKAETLATAFRVPQRTLVVTDRPEWARALATEPDVILAPGKSHERLLALPLARLALVGDPLAKEEDVREREALAAFMKRVGMHTLGDFARLPLSAIGRRFGKSGVVLHEWVMGQREVALPPFVFVEPIREHLDCDEVTSLEALLLGLAEVLARVEARLRGRMRLAKQLRLTFILESHPALTRTLELSAPCQEAQAMVRLLRDFLSGLSWESPLVRLEVEVSDTLPWQPGQLSLFDDIENKFPELALYVGRLRARFGDHRVGFPKLVESHLPERAWRPCFPPEAPPPKRAFYPKRPLFLFDPPRPVSSPASSWDLTPSENLASEWWEETGNRSYFVAKNPQGECLWVFWDHRQKGWYLHGTFD